MPQFVVIVFAALYLPTDKPRNVRGQWNNVLWSEE